MAGRVVSRTRRERNRWGGGAPGRHEKDLGGLPELAPAEGIQTIIETSGKEGGVDNLRDWLRALCETLLGSSQGPRMGSFIALYGVQNSRKLIAEALA